MRFVLEEGRCKEWGRLVANIKNMYTGNGVVDDIGQIVDIHKNG